MDTTTEVSDVTRQEFEDALSNGSYAWPGGYPMFLLMEDGEAMHIKCAEENRACIVDSIDNDLNNGWKPAAVDVNWEDDKLVCCQCGKEIESAYGGA